MKVVKVIFIVIMFLGEYSNAQYEICDKLHFRGHYVPFDTSGIQSIEDYARIYFPRQRRHVSNRNELEKFHLWLNFDSLLVFINDSVEISMVIDKKKIDTNDIFYPKEKEEKFSIIRDYAANTLYGITSEDTIVNYVKKIIINGVELPTDTYDDLLKPNRFETILSIKPIEVFKSKDGEYFYIYIFGELNRNLMSIDEAMELSYMAKIIVTKKGYFVGRIVESGFKLKYFGFDQCPNFIGF